MPMKYFSFIFALFISSTSFAVLNGKEVSQADRPYVISYSAMDAGDICTATVLSPRVLLTASHCLLNGKNTRRIYLKGNWRTVKVIKNPETNWDMAIQPASTDAQADIVVIVLENLKFNLSKYPTLEDYDQAPYFDKHNKKTATLIGAGPASVRAIRDPVKDKMFMKQGLRSMESVILGFISNQSYFMASADPKISVCRGDSGSSIFDGENIIGVVSMRSEKDRRTQEINKMSSHMYCKLGDFPFYAVNIKPYINKINEIIYAAENDMSLENFKLE